MTGASGAVTGAVVAADGSLVGLVPTWGTGCLARGDRLRDWHARAGVAHAYARQVGALEPDLATKLELCAGRLIWDAPAAGEYPRPLLADAERLAELWPELSAVVWHHVAGATILAGFCECLAQPAHPAGHRDALMTLGRAVRARAAELRARAQVTT